MPRISTKRLAFGFALLVMAVTAARGQEAVPFAAPQLEVTSLSISKPKARWNQPARTTVDVLLKVPGRDIVSISPLKDPIAISDDRGQVLGTDDSVGGGSGEDETSRELSFSVDQLPSPEAKRLKVHGVLRVKLGWEPRREKLNVKYAKGEDLLLGEIPVTISQYGKTPGTEFILDLVERAWDGNLSFEDLSRRTTFVMQTTKTGGFQSIKSIVLKDAADKEVNVQDSSLQWLKEGMGDDALTTYDYIMVMGEAPEAGSIEVIHYSKMEVIELPVDLSVGVGLR